MFNMGMGELLVILLVALLVLGPKRLPEVASGLGKAIREFRRATKDIEANLQADETVGKPLQELKMAMHGDPSLPAATPGAAPANTVAAETVKPAEQHAAEAAASAAAPAAPAPHATPAAAQAEPVAAREAPTEAPPVVGSSKV